MAISSLLSASTSSRTGRPRPLSSSGFIAIAGGSRVLPRSFFSLPGNGRELGHGDDDLPSGGGGGGGGWGIGGEGSASAVSEVALAVALHQPTTEDNDTVSSYLGSATRYMRIHSTGNNKDVIETVMPHDIQTLQDILQQIDNGNSQAKITKLLPHPQITYLLEQYVNNQTKIADLLEQSVNSQTKIADLLEQSVNSQRKITDLLEQSVNGQTKITNRMITVTGMDPSIVPVVANSSIDDDHVNMRKGLLGFTYTIAEKMIPLYSLLVTFSLTDPHAKVSYADIWTQVICLANFMSTFASIFMAAFASNFKESELVENNRFEIFIWLLLLELLAFITECFITISLFTHMTNWVLCSFGITCFCSTALLWAVYYERPKFLNKCITKMGSSLQGWIVTQPDQQVQTGTNHIP